jgi:carbamoyl-phosphate synthase small subunit
VGISEIDTRMLTRHLRTHGAKRGVISTLSEDREALIARARGSRDMVGLDLAREVTCEKSFQVEEPIATALRGAIPEGGHYKVVAYDFGMKLNIVRMLAASGCDVTVVPATTPGEDALAMKPDGVFLSNGPGDPEPCTYAIESSRRIMKAGIPIFGICLGHQILGLACGAKTFKLKFGHRGANHPVKNLKTGHVEVTSQNHGFSVDPEAFAKKPELILTHTNLNDGTVEGFRHRDLPVVSVQYHPEASPGPHDSHYLFGEFVEMMSAKRKARR